MQDANDATLSLADDQFWGDPGAALADPLSDRMEAGITGLVIAAPAQVVTSARETLPIVGLYTATLRAAKTAQLRDQLLLVAVNVDSREVFADLAFAPLEELREGVDSDDDPGEGITGISLHFDAFERLGLAREPGRWIIQLIHRDQTSNRVEVELVGEPTRYRDEAVEAYLRSQSARVSPTRTIPAIPWSLEQQLPAFDDDARDAPEVPREPGLHLAAPRVFLRSSGASCVLSGSFRLAARPRDLVDPERWPRPTKSQLHDAHGYEPPTPAAVLPLTLLTTGSEAAGPRLTRLELPSFDHLDPEVSAELAPSTHTGRFALDLLTHGALMNDPQTCFIYAFAGELLSAPIAIGVVSPDMLPPGHPDAARG